MGAPSRRAVIAGTGLALGAGPALAAPASAPGDMSLGDPNAPVRMVEYASLSCSHCAHFHEEVFPALKAKHIDTGRVRFTLREMLTPPAAVAAAGFLMARCAGPGRYFKVVGEVFASQPRWTAGAVKPVLLQIAQANGLTEAQFEACITDAQALKALEGRVRQAIAAGVTSTPTFFVDGVEVTTHHVDLAALDAAIAAAGGR